MFFLTLIIFRNIITSLFFFLVHIEETYKNLIKNGSTDSDLSHEIHHLHRFTNADSRRCNNTNCFLKPKYNALSSQIFVYRNYFSKKFNTNNFIRLICKTIVGSC